MKNPRAVLTLSAAALLLAACSHSKGRVTHIPVENAPAAVQAGFAANFPGLTISHVDRIKMTDGTTRYELKFRDADNAYHRKIFTSEGALVGDKENVALQTTPPAK